MPEQNGWYFSDNIFKCILFNQMFCILIQISLKFDLKDQIVSSGSDNGFAHARYQTITWTKVGQILSSPDPNELAKPSLMAWFHWIWSTLV